MSVYIDQALLDNEALTDEPLTHARILAQSVMDDGIVTGTQGQVGFPLIGILNPATYERYKPVGSVFAEIIMDCVTVKKVDYFAMQTRFVLSATLFKSDDAITWVEIGAISFDDDRTAIALIPVTESRYYKLVLTGSFIEVIAIKVGKSLAMQRAIHAGHAPINLSPSRVIRPSVSETGQWLGASEQRKGFSASYNWTNLNTSWYRQNFDRFVQSSPRVNPFFIAWRPKTYLNDVAYCLATNDVYPSFTGVKDFMSVSLNVEGFSDVV